MNRIGYRGSVPRPTLTRWGSVRCDQVKPVAVEEWLDSIKRAKATRARIRNLMSALFHHAMRYEWVEKNPIKLVRQSAKRERTPDVLEWAEIQLRQVARANGIYKDIGWHTFRHSFGTLLKANGEDVKTVQELLRHASSRITLDVYTQAVNATKREAQSKVVRMIVPGAGQTTREADPQGAV